MKRKQILPIVDNVHKIALQLTEKLKANGYEISVWEQYDNATQIIIANAQIELLANMNNILVHIAESLNSIAGSLVHEQRPDVSAEDLGMEES